MISFSIFFQTKFLDFSGLTSRQWWGLLENLPPFLLLLDSRLEDSVLQIRDPQMSKTSTKKRLILFTSCIQIGERRRIGKHVVRLVRLSRPWFRQIVCYIFQPDKYPLVRSEGESIEKKEQSERILIPRKGEKLWSTLMKILVSKYRTHFSAVSSESDVRQERAQLLLELLGRAIDLSYKNALLG